MPAARCAQIVRSRVLVMPPPYPLYLLDHSQLEGVCSAPRWNRAERACTDYFDADDIRRGVETISFKQFLQIIGQPHPEQEYIGL